MKTASTEVLGRRISGTWKLAPTSQNLFYHTDRKGLWIVSWQSDRIDSRIKCENDYLSDCK